MKLYFRDMFRAAVPMLPYPTEQVQISRRATTRRSRSSIRSPARPRHEVSRS